MVMFSQAALDKAIGEALPNEMVTPGKSALIATTNESGVSIAAIVHNDNGRLTLKAYIEHDWNDGKNVISNAGVSVKVEL